VGGLGGGGGGVGDILTWKVCRRDVLNAKILLLFYLAPVPSSVFPRSGLFFLSQLKIDSRLFSTGADKKISLNVETEFL